nr:uridine diphosphate glucose pyrophosphatase NUDT22-like [Cherax quadricarinatus]
MACKHQRLVVCMVTSRRVYHSMRNMSIERVKWWEEQVQLVSSHTPVTHTQVTAKFEPSKFARRSSLDVEQQINKVWEAKCAQNPRLYNGDKFRLAGWNNEEGKWVLHIGLTCYKDLCGTNLAQNYRWIQEKGTKDFGNMQAYMSDPIGVEFSSSGGGGRSWHP